MKADHQRCIYIICARLGKTPDEVAGKLRELGIKGARGSHYNNPLSRYIDRFHEFGFGSSNISSNTVVIEYTHKFGVAYFDWFPYKKYPGLQPVGEFLRRFHEGRYPELES
jgi:hypothetical protein